MKRHTTREMLGAYRDGELDTARRIEIEEHLEECPPCSRMNEEDHAVAEALALRARRFEAAAALQAQVLANLRAEQTERRTRAFPQKQKLTVWAMGAVALLGGFVAKLTAGISRNTYLARAEARLRKSSSAGDKKDSRS